ncbi:MAG: LemA family protein [Alphaproteobacteria bacterium]|nr:LemA family protein [Alphaproteobacteria bacterium]
MENIDNSAVYWLAGAGALIIYLILTYNRGVSLRNYVQEAFATMDVYLKKRWDLVPNLIEIVKNYAKHEKTLLEDLTKLRTKSYSELSDAEKLETNTQLGQQLSKIVAVAENYPDLKANQSYMLLMQQMSAVEEDIANARKYYNGTVREFNTFLDIFPTNIIGKLFGWQRSKMFEIENEQRENVKVEV